MSTDEYVIQPYCIIETHPTSGATVMSTLDLAGLGKASRSVQQSLQSLQNSRRSFETDDEVQAKVFQGGFGGRPVRSSSDYRTFDVDCFGMPIEGDCVLRLRDASKPKRDTAFVCFHTGMMLHAAQTQAQVAGSSTRPAGLASAGGASSRTIIDDCNELI